MTMISIEQFAKLSAQVEAGTPLPQLLQDAKLAPQQWLAAQRRWLVTITREAQLGGGPNGKRYLSAFMHSSTASTGSEATAEAATAAAATAAHSAIPPAAPAHAAPAHAAPAHAAPSPAAPPHAAPSHAAPPHATPAPVPPGAAPAQPSGRRPHRTSAMQAMSPAAILTPFARDTAAQPPPPAAASIAHEAAGLIGETTAVTALSDEELQDGLPFETSVDEGVEASVDTTGAMAVLDIDEPDLPFTEQGSAPAPAAASIEREASALAGETAFVSALSDDELEAATPFDEPTGGEHPPASAATAATAAAATAATAAAATTSPASGSGVAFPRLTVQQYASLSVDLHSTGDEPRAATLQRYGMADEAQLAALIAAWNTHFRNHPADYGRFRAAYDQYSTWLKSRGT